LLAYAENLLDRREAIDRSMAAHVHACPACKAEVEAIQASLAFVATAGDLEPAAELTARILMAGQVSRGELRRESTPLKLAWKAAQAGACAAAILAIAGLTFSAFLDSSEGEAAGSAFDRPVPTQATSGRSPEAIRQAAMEVAAEVRTLSAAVSGKHDAAPSPETLEEMRVVQSRDADIAAAVSALERNPNSVRATHVVHATLKQQAESLRNIYVEGGSL